MLRKLYFEGNNIIEKHLVIGNHNNVRISAKGTFFLDGLVYCPKYTLIISLKGSGTLALHGICKKMIIRSISGDCHLHLDDLKVKEFSCESIGGNSVLRMRQPRIVIEKNVRDNARVIFESRQRSSRTIEVAVSES